MTTTSFSHGRRLLQIVRLCRGMPQFYDMGSRQRLILTGRPLLSLAIVCAFELGVTVARETALGQAALIEPTTVPGYVGCIQQTGSQCVGGNNVEAQAPFDANSACPTTPLYESSGLLADAQTITNQVRYLCCNVAALHHQPLVNALPAVQIGTCINAVRENPDTFACQYHCDYSSWRQAVVSPPEEASRPRAAAVQQSLWREPPGSCPRCISRLQPIPWTKSIIYHHKLIFTAACRAAQGHAQDMASNNYFGHTGTDGSGLGDRAANAGFFTYPLGENIAAGFNSVQDLVLAMMWYVLHLATNVSMLHALQQPRLPLRWKSPVNQGVSTCVPVCSAALLVTGPT